MKAPVTVPLDLLRRWFDAENAFIDAVAENIRARFCNLAAAEAQLERLQELHHARLAIDIILRSNDRSKRFVEAVVEQYPGKPRREMN